MTTHFVMAAASYHLAHFSARAYSLLAIVEADENFSPIERVLAQLMRRNLAALRASVLDYRTSGEGSVFSVTLAAWTVSGVISLAAITGGVALMGRLAQLSSVEEQPEDEEVPSNPLKG